MSAIVQGAGYPNPNRSHFRSMDVWHTAESEKIGADGLAWAPASGNWTREPRNVLTGVNFGRGLPRALAKRRESLWRRSVTWRRTAYSLTSRTSGSRSTLSMRSRRCTAALEGKDAVSEFLGSTGMDVLKGADILRSAPEKYSSSVEYAANPIAR